MLQQQQQAHPVVVAGTRYVHAVPAVQVGTSRLLVNPPGAGEDSLPLDSASCQVCIPRLVMLRDTERSPLSLVLQVRVLDITHY